MQLLCVVVCRDTLNTLKNDLDRRCLTRLQLLPLIVHGTERGNIINGSTTADDLLSGN